MVSRVLWIRLHASARRASQRRSVKRKLDQEDGGAHLDQPADGSAFADVAKAAEMAAIREALERQQRSIQKLCAELDGERTASSTATNEAMLMILRLQREKAEVQMEFGQFKRFAEEKMDNDQRELAARDYLLYKRDEALRSLYSELHAYQCRLLSYPEIPDAAAARFADLPAYDYPKLRCEVSLDLEPDGDDDDIPLETRRGSRAISRFGMAAARSSTRGMNSRSRWKAGHWMMAIATMIRVIGCTISMQCTGFRAFGGATATRAQQGRRGKGEWMEGRRKR